MSEAAQVAQMQDMHAQHMLSSLSQIFVQCGGNRPRVNSSGTIPCPACGGVQRWARGASKAIYSRCDTPECMEWHSLR